jgi:hypothetical protein
MTRLILAIAIIALTAFILSGHQASAQAVWNPITNCYDDPSGVAPPVCPRGGNQAAPRPPQDNRPDTWAAIAISPSTLDWGSAFKRQSEKAAKAGALANCGERARDCQIAISTYDDCIALAASPSQHLWKVGGPNRDVRDAKQVAIIHCQRAGGRSCIVVASACSDG